MKKAAIVVIASLSLTLLVSTSIFLFTMDKIDLREYETAIDYGTLSAEQIKVMDAILLCGKTGATRIDQGLSTNEEFDEVIAYIGLYFGTNLKHMNVALWRPGYAIVKPELLRELERDKAALDAEIDRALSKMYDGTDRFKLWQISNYIATTIRYSTHIDVAEPLSGMPDKGVCSTYSVLFYKMARRIGIEAHMCAGYVFDGIRVAGHQWNMVELDGEQYFYDVTWYDSPFPFPWIHDRTGWGRNYSVLPNRQALIKEE